jgi:hypothetical protein
MKHEEVKNVKNDEKVYAVDETFGEDSIKPAKKSKSGKRKTKPLDLDDDIGKIYPG